MLTSVIRFADDENEDSLCVTYSRGVHFILSTKGNGYMVKVTNACECAAHRAVQNMLPTQESVIMHIACQVWTGVCVVVMRDAGPDLMKMAMTKPIPPLQAMRYIKQVAQFVQWLHDRHWSHCDIKPENICGEKLIDYGSMRKLYEDKANCYGSTPNYFKPSLLNKTLTPRFDAYGLAVTLAVILYGEMPPDIELTREMAQTWGDRRKSVFAEFVGELFAQATAKGISDCLQKQITKLELEPELELEHQQGLQVSGRTATI